MFGKHPKAPGPYSPFSAAGSAHPGLAPFVQTYVVPEVQTVQTHFIKHHVYKYVRYYPHTHSFEQRAHVHQRWKPAGAQGYRSATEYPYKNTLD